MGSIQRIPSGIRQMSAMTGGVVQELRCVAKDHAHMHFSVLLHDDVHVYMYDATADVKRTMNFVPTTAAGTSQLVRHSSSKN